MAYGISFMSQDGAPRPQRLRLVMGAQAPQPAMTADAEFGRAMEREYAPTRNYGFAPVVLAAFSFWGVIGVSLNWVLHH
jgi:hypothetical protein